MCALGLRCCTKAFSGYSKWGLLSNSSARASHCAGFSGCRAWALGCLGFSKWGVWDQQLWCTSLVAPWYEKTTSIFNTFSVLSSLRAYSLLWIQWPALYILVQLNHHLYTSSVSICLVSLLVYVLSPKPQYVQNLLILVFFPQPPPLVLKFSCDLRIYNNTKLITESYLNSIISSSHLVSILPP